MIEIWVDGSGKSRYGYVVELDGTTMHNIVEATTSITNNEAEYLAIKEALTVLDRAGRLKDEIYIYIQTVS